MIQKPKRYIYSFTALTSLLLLAGVWVSSPRITLAADTDFSNGITVDSTGDGADANISDSICDDGSGNCTLRAAIEEANDEAGTQTISFNITGAADFTNGGQNGYTIQPQSALPNLTDTVIIDGYTQPGAQANTAVAPNPLNGRLLIEIDGTGIANNCLVFDGSDSSTVRGLIINSCEASGISIGDSDSVTIAGNYVGTDHTGLTAVPNGETVGSTSVAVNVGVNCTSSTDTTTTNTLIGGSTPESRNLISGNRGAGMGVCGVDTTIQGNYVGVDAGGLTALENSSNAGDQSGGATIDYADGVLVGGSGTGQMNIFSGNDNAGVSPAYTENITLQGNYLGVGYDGITAIPNDTGFNCLTCQTVVLGGDGQGEGNIFSGNVRAGISIDDTSDVTIEGNIVGLDRTGLDPLPNQFGIGVNDSSDIQIGGNSQSKSNTISANQFANLVYWLQSDVSGVVDTRVQGNNIGPNINGNIDPSFDNGIAMLLHGPANDNVIGGANPGEGNIIAGNEGGILIANYTITGLGSLPTANNSVIGNSIYSNYGNVSLAGIGNTSGIDLLSLTENDFPPSPFDSDISTDAGPNMNDAGDSDTGANGFINFPVINSAIQDGTTVTANLDLDAADTTDPDGLYRIELFSNDTPDPSGYGEGQTFLGHAMVANGTDQDIEFTVPSGTNLDGKVLSATTTAINDTTTSGFGSTSEFSLVSDNVTVLAAAGIGSEGTGSLADTGQDTRLVLLAGLSIMSGAFVTIRLTRKYTYIIGR